MNRIRKIFLLSLFVTTALLFTSLTKAYGEDTVKRIYGNDNCATSIEISKEGWPEGGSRYAVLVTGDDFPDALCASPLAKMIDAPIIMLCNSSIDDRVLNELERLGVKKAFLIGGTGVIPESVETVLHQNGIKYERLYGSDRYGTSLDVAEYIAGSTGKIDEVAIVTGENYPDALSIASIASMKGMPIILSEKSQLSKEFKDYIEKNDVEKSYIIGGEGVISDDILNSLPSPERLGGADRYDTNALVLDYFLNSGEFDFSTTYMATGNDFADALAVSALAAKSSSPIVLLDTVPTQSTLDIVAKDRLLMKQIVVIGRQDVLPDSTVEPMLPKVVTIQDLRVVVNEGDNYVLPESIPAIMDNNSVENVDVAWSTDVPDTNNQIVQTFSGNVKGYVNEIKLTLIIKHPIMGKSVVTAEQMEKFLLNINPTPQINGVSALELAQLFLDEGDAEGVRGDIAFCQSIYETGWFKFGGQVLPEQNNYAGIGATNGSSTGKGAWFDSALDGVRAQIQHLKAYASQESMKNPVIDPRYDILKKNNLLGIAPDWEDLSGRWAVPGYDTNKYASFDDAIKNGAAYGQNILGIYEKLKSKALN